MSLKTLSQEPRTVEVAGEAKPQPPIAADSRGTGPKPHLVLCAPDDVRELLAASTKYAFIPYGKADPEILKGITQSQIDGVLIHFKAKTDGLSDFINITSQEFPDLPCFILCHQNDLSEVAQCGWHVIAVRDFTSLSEIEEKLQRSLFLFPWMKRDVLRKILGVLKTIPTEAASHQRIVEELKNPQFSLDHVAELIKQDPALTAQLLKMVNSPVFLRGNPVQNVDEAVSILGALKLQALIASAWAFFMIKDDACKGFHPQNEWKHAVEIADRVRKLCEEEGLGSQVTETAITAAMLHDLGKLLLAANMPGDYAIVLGKASKGQAQSWQVEDRLFGFNHAEVGGCLLGLWGVPLPVVEAVMLHHTDGLTPGSAAALIQKAHQENTKSPI